MITPQEKSRCCNRCFRSEDERMDLPYCANPSCPCHSPAATPLLMGICCEQCLIDLEYKGAKQCSDNDCLCHQPSPADTKVEDWAPTTRKFLRQFIPKCHTNGNCVGCDADMDAIINSISSLIEKVRQEAVSSQRDTLVEGLEGMKVAHAGDVGAAPTHRKAHNEAIDAAIKLIKEMR